jgi:hypothetical protein
MTQTTAKKPAGRPPRQVEEKTEKKIFSHSYKEEEGPKDEVYEIVKDKSISFFIRSSNVQVYDKETDTVRLITYAPGEKSIFVDEQSQYAKREPVVFRNGYLMVPKTNPTLKKFLAVHPSNVANGGNIFKLQDLRVDKEKELKQEFEVFDAVSLVRTKTIDELIPVAMYFHVNTDRPADEIKFDLLRIAKSKPSAFVEAFDNPTVKTKAILRKANDYQIIKVKEDGCYWTDSGSMIVSVPVGKDPYDVLTRFCLTENGSSVMSSIEEELAKI